MIVACPSCQSRFQYDEARFQGAPAKRFRCPRCSHVFEVPNPALAEPVPEAIPAPPPVEVSVPAPAGPQEPTAAFDAAQLRAKLGLMPYEALPPAPAPASPRETTSRRGRNAMLHAAGLAGGLPPGIRYSLAFLSGPRASTVKVLESSLLVIGREEGEVVTGDPETSRRHAQIEIHEDGSAWISDLGSTNGTYVDGKPIQEPLQLHDRTEFSCGKSSFMLLIRREDGTEMD